MQEKRTVTYDPRYENRGNTCYINAALQLLRPCILSIIEQKNKPPNEEYFKSGIGMALSYLYDDKDKERMNYSTKEFIEYYTAEQKKRKSDVLKPGSSMVCNLFIFNHDELTF